ncbi:MAG: CPBP family intramembrane metalloprotease [Flavobacteriaceae bacterium]|nr:MAG: CPBP family intramembrane metalloprotease [Flavobacteriaceae bacterium]
MNLLLFIGPYILVVGLLRSIGAFIAGVDLTNDFFIETTTQHLLVSFFGFLGTFMIIFFFIKFIEKEDFINLGFHYKNHKKNILAGFIIGFLVMSLAYLMLTFFHQIKFVKIVFKVEELFLSTILFLIVAVTEETLIRGYVLRNLMNSTKKNVALILSSFLFSFLHVFNTHFTGISFVSLFLSGILLGLLYIYTKNLWLPIALHFSWNLFQSLLGFNVSGHDSYSIIEFDLLNKNAISGGDFGFEGSILSVIIQVFLIILTIFYFSNLKKKKIRNKNNP